MSSSDTLNNLNNDNQNTKLNNDNQNNDNQNNNDLNNNDLNKDNQTNNDLNNNDLNKDNQNKDNQTNDNQTNDNQNKDNQTNDDLNKDNQNKDNQTNNDDLNNQNNDNLNNNFNKYFNNILNKLNIENVLSNEYKLQLCKLFIHRLKKNKECLKLFKNRNYKCFDIILFFSNENDKKMVDYLKDKDVSDEIWTELQLIILLYEINNNGSKKLIKKLYKKIKVYNKNKNFDDDIKHSKDYVNSNNDFKLPDFGNLGNLGNLGDINLDNMKNLFGAPDKDKTDKTKSLINNIFDDIKNKLDSKDSFNTSDIFSISKELSENYKNKINPSELNLSSVFNSIIDIVKNPEYVSNKFKGVEKKINTNTGEMMKEMQKNLFGNKNPLDLLNNVGDVGLDKVVSTLTNNYNMISDENKMDPQTKKNQIDQFYDKLQV